MLNEEIWNTCGKVNGRSRPERASIVSRRNGHVIRLRERSHTPRSAYPENADVRPHKINQPFA